MTAVQTSCPRCIGQGWLTPPDKSWVLCALCDGVGRTWVARAPLFGCKITLAERNPGEIVTLGNGDRGRILFHSPRKKKGSVPESTYLGLMDDFDDAEDHAPTRYPSCVGVAAVGVPRAPGDDHHGERSPDPSDPMQREPANLL